MTLNFSHSAYTDLKGVAQGGCPKKWFTSWVEKNRPEPSEAMLLGSYFEQLCLGDSTSKELIQPPLTKNGNTPAKWLRVIEQAAEFNALFDPDNPDGLDYSIMATQIVLHDEERKEKGIYDFLAIDKDNNLCRFELKLTGDLTNTWGDYQWGNLLERSWLQPLIYARLWENLKMSEKYLKKFKFGTIRDYVYVADYSTSMNKKLIPLEITPQGIGSVQEHVDTYWDMVEHYEREGWFTDGSERECKNCPLKENCPGFVGEEKKEEKEISNELIIEEPIKL